MPKRKKDPTTGQPQLTYKEQVLVNEFFRNGGNGAQAAAAAGYKAARLDQAAYQALHRECVQQHIRERIRESRVSADEIVGTLVSHMRGNLTEFLDQFGNFSIEVAKQKGIGHLIKSISGTISGTICDPPFLEALEELKDPEEPEDAQNAEDRADGEPLENPRHPRHTHPERANGQTCKQCGRRPTKPSNPRNRKRRTAPRQPSFRIQLHSPLQAASILARLIGPDRHRPYRPLNQPATRNLQPATKLAANPDFDPNALLQAVIEEQMKEHGLSREAVAHRILQVRPEFAKYLDELPTTPRLIDQLDLRDSGKLLAVILDAVASLKSSLANPTSDDRVLQACQQVDAMIPLLDPRLDDSAPVRHPGSGSLPIAPGAHQASKHLEPPSSAFPASTAAHSSEPPPDVNGSQESQSPSPPTGTPVPITPLAITNDDFAAAVDRIIARLSDPERDKLIRLQVEAVVHQGITQDALPTTDHEVPFSQPAIDDPISHSNITVRDIDHSHPEPNPNLQPHTAGPQPATCNMQPATNFQPATNSLDSFRRTYSGITRPFQFGQLDNHFTEVIDHIMKDQSLTPQQAVDAIWLAARQSTWSSANLIDRCIAEFAALHPRLAQAQPPVCAKRPLSPPRYHRPGVTLSSAPPKTCSADEADDSDDYDDLEDPGILTSTQLFRREPPTTRSG
jgi:phage terminase small subunit